MIKIQYYKSPFGELIIGDYKGEICLCDWRYRKMRNSIDKRIQSNLDATYTEEKTPIIQNCVEELEEYFQGKRSEFNIPIKLVGSEFQIQVWEALMKIPYGKTESYLSLSQIIGNEKAIRAVSTANGANAISILVPCHRVIGSDGKLVGYAGGLNTKKKLLELEGAIQTNSQLSLEF